MIRSHLKIAFRHLWRSKGYTLINGVGLAVGIAACLFMLVYIRHEIGFDQFHPDVDRLYRLGTVIERDGRSEKAAYIHAPLDAELGRVAGIESVTRIGGSRRLVAEQGGEHVYFRGLSVADEHVFDVLGYSLERGDPETALADPYSIVVTEELGRQLTDTSDPMGEVVTLSGHDHTITGILNPVPSNSHWQFEGLRSKSTDRAVFGAMYDRLMGSWNSLSHTYVRLEEERSPDDVAATVNALLQELRPDNTDPSYSVFLQPVTDIHFGEAMSGGVGSTASRTRLTVFSAIAVLILLIACINYTNLATARSIRRAREIGIRKTFGAERRQLIGWILAESVLLASFAVVVAVGLVELAFPVLESFIGRPLQMRYLSDPVVLLGLPTLALVVGGAAGAYPAVVLASASPLDVFRGRTPTGSLGTVRKGLVVLQFAVSIALIAGTGIIRDQLDFIRTTDVGFDRDQVVSVAASSPQAFNDNFDALRDELSRIPGVESLTASMGRPGIDVPENTFNPDEEGTAESIDYKWLAIDHDFLETFHIDLMAGRDLDPTRPSDATDAVLVNRTAVDVLGLDDPVGKELTFEINNRSGTIVGVVEDFHVGPLSEPIAPTFMYITPRYFYSYVHLRVSDERVVEVVDAIRDTWRSFFPDDPFELTFYDDAFEAQYTDERRLARIAGFASLLAIFVACLGLFGLASFTARQRMAEIGIRKVLGASVGSVVALLSRQFLLLVAGSLFIAVPVTWLVMDRWLSGFAFHVIPGPMTFVVAILVSGGVAMLAVGGQALRAALANPIDSLRSE